MRRRKVAPERLVTRRLTKRYVLALGAIALLCVVGQIVVQFAIARQTSDARVISLAANQVTLCEEIVTDALAIQVSTDGQLRTYYLNDTVARVTRLERVQYALQYGDSQLGLPPEESPRITALFALIAPNFEQVEEGAIKMVIDVRSFATDQSSAAPSITSVAAPYARSLLLTEPGFVSGMQIIVAEFQQEAERRVDSLRTLEMALTGMTLLVVLALGLLLFRPITRAVGLHVAALSAANDQLRVLSEKATESSRLKSEFLANMSHEIRTPMNGVIGMTELALQGDIEPETADYIRTAHDSALALLTILNDILDFSKIEAGKLELESVLFDPREIVEGVAELFAPRAAEKRLTIMTDVAGEVPGEVYGDPSRVRQVLLNLAGNAVKFTEQGYVLIRLGMGIGSTASVANLRFEVTDTGVGIPEAQRDRLFEAFTQLDGSTTRRFGGTGLGLSISKRIVELMDGSIGVESAEGNGSTFWVELSCAVGPGSSLGVIHAEDVRSESLVGCRALVVDDNDVQREILHRYLSGWGLFVEDAADGPAALERMRNAAARGEPFDLALLDLMLPGIDGLTIARAIKVDPRIAGARLVLQTALDQTSLRQQALRAGFAACLSKPIKRETLLLTLAQVVSGAERRERRGGGLEPSTAHAPASRRSEQRVGASTVDAEEVAMRAPSDASVGGFGWRILLAEDNSVNRKLASLQLRKLGCEVEVACDGREALAKLREGRFDLVLMDCHMPEMDGFEATAAIRAEEQRSGRHQPIVAMTAEALQGDRDRCIAAGMDDYVAKPVTIEDLGAALGRWLPKASSLEPSDHAIPNRAAAGETVKDEAEVGEPWRGIAMAEGAAGEWRATDLPPA